MVKHEKNVNKIGLQSSFFKPATNGQSGKGFLLTSKVCPQGVVCACPGTIYIYKIIKNVYKIRLLFLNLPRICKVIRAFCWHQYLSPRSCLPLPWAYIHVQKHENIYQDQVSGEDLQDHWSSGFFVPAQSHKHVSECEFALKLYFW